MVDHVAAIFINSANIVLHVIDKYC